MSKGFTAGDHPLLDSTTTFFVVSRAKILASWASVRSTVLVQELVGDVDSAESSPSRQRVPSFKSVVFRFTCWVPWGSFTAVQKS